MSSPQDSLFDAIQAPRPRHRLFFALVPPDRVRGKIAGAAATVREGGALPGRWVRPARYHLTLAFLGDHVALDEVLLTPVRAAADAVAAQAASFVWQGRRIDSFRGRQPPCVLRGDAEEAPGMLALWSSLRRELAVRALDRHMERSFVPHVTLAYGERALSAPVPLEDGVDWPVDAFELLDAEVGRPDYHSLGRWRLAG